MIYSFVYYNTEFDVVNLGKLSQFFNLGKAAIRGISSSSATTRREYGFSKLVIQGLSMIQKSLKSLSWR